jgi:hypothetical protein
MIVKVHLSLRIRQLNFKQSQELGNKFTHRRHHKIPPNTSPRSSSERKHIPFHMCHSIGFKPSIWVEFRGIGAKDLSISVDYPSVCARSDR